MKTVVNTVASRFNIIAGGDRIGRAELFIPDNGIGGYWIFFLRSDETKDIANREEWEEIAWVQYRCWEDLEKALESAAEKINKKGTDNVA